MRFAGGGGGEQGGDDDGDTGIDPFARRPGERARPPHRGVRIDELFSVYLETSEILAPPVWSLVGGLLAPPPSVLTGPEPRRGEPGCGTGPAGKIKSWRRSRHTARDQQGNWVTGRLEGMTEQVVPRSSRPEDWCCSSLNRRGAEHRRQPGADLRLGPLLPPARGPASCGVPMLRAIRLLAGMRSNRRLSQVLGEVADSVEEGERLADSMATFPQTFPEIHPIIRAGERAGFIESALDRLATFMTCATCSRRCSATSSTPSFCSRWARDHPRQLVFVPRFEDFFAGTTCPRRPCCRWGCPGSPSRWPLLLVLLAAAVPLVLYARRQRAWRLAIERLGWPRARPARPCDRLRPLLPDPRDHAPERDPADRIDGDRPRI